MKKGCRNMYKVYDARVISSFYVYNSNEDAHKQTFIHMQTNYTS